MFILSVVLVWILSVLGIAITYIVLLGAAMSTVPQRLNIPTAFGLAVLPVLVVIGVVLIFWKGSQPFGKNLLFFGIPFLMSMVTFVMIGSSVKPNQIGAPYTEYYGKDTDTPEYSLEIRMAYPEPMEGCSEMLATHGDSATYYVANEILFTQADLISTATRKEIRSDPTTITLSFHGGAQPRLKEISQGLQGQHWAILLDGELLLVCRMEGPLERSLTLGPVFDDKDAERLARGMVQEL